MKFQADLLREFAIRYVLNNEDVLRHIYLELQYKEQEAISARNQGRHDGFIDMGLNVSVSVQDIITHTQNSRLFRRENRPLMRAKAACKHVDMKIDSWMQENKNIDILQDVVTSLGKKHKQGPLEIANYLKSKDFHNFLQFFFQNGIDPCCFMYDVIRSYIGYASDRNMLLYGPMMSGKSTLTNALRCILPACSSADWNNWWNRYSFFSVSTSRLLIFDNATEKGFENMNKRCRSALKNQPIKVKGKYGKEQEIPCPAVIVSTNLDPSEFSEEIKSSFKIYNFYKPVTNAQVQSLLNLEAFERFFVYIVCGHMATFWVKNGDPLFSDFADSYKDLYKLIEEFAPNPSTPFYDPTFSLLREMSPNLLQSRQSTTVVENNVLNSKRFLHIPSVLPQLNLVQRYITNHEGKSVVLETSQCLKDSEAHKIVKVRDFFLKESRAQVMRFKPSAPAVIPDRFSIYLDDVAIDEEGIPRTTDRETDTEVPVASSITGQRKRKRTK